MRTLRQACCQEIPGSAMCVQNLDDSRGLAIRITYRISLRSSSLWEPRHPPLKVVYHYGSYEGRVLADKQHKTRAPLYTLGSLALGWLVIGKIRRKSPEPAHEMCAVNARATTKFTGKEDLGSVW